jgi:hypothetical protein
MWGQRDNNHAVFTLMLLGSMHFCNILGIMFLLHQRPTLGGQLHPLLLNAADNRRPVTPQDRPRGDAGRRHGLLLRRRQQGHQDDQVSQAKPRFNTTYDRCILDCTTGVVMCKSGKGHN